MAALRNTYRAEAILDAKEAAMARAREAAHREARARAVADEIARFRAAAASAAAAGGPHAHFQDDSSSMRRDSAPRDAIADALTAVQGTKETASARSRSKDNGYSAYVEQRRGIRRETEVQRQEHLAERRRHSLLYLLHAADSFVTKTNLDQQIDKCLGLGTSPPLPYCFIVRGTTKKLILLFLDNSSMTFSSTFSWGDHSYISLLRAAKQKVDGSEIFISNDERRMDARNMKGIDTDGLSTAMAHTHETIQSQRLSSARNTLAGIAGERRAILADVARGTVMGRDGFDHFEKDA
ncbi:hypothetical protein HDU84_005199 [Entophlyctis sp. JEL0112]|nr:hypothetical protein HDU84_005199 [Entophlyctis sp. JEL0112]